jgi:hypothetical protein
MRDLWQWSTTFGVDVRQAFENLDKRIAALEESVKTIHVALNEQLPAVTVTTVNELRRVEEDVSNSLSDLMALVYSRSADECIRIREELPLPALAGVAVRLKELVPTAEPPDEIPESAIQPDQPDAEFIAATTALQERWDAGWGEDADA